MLPPPNSQSPECRPQAILSHSLLSVLDGFRVLPPPKLRSLLLLARRCILSPAGGDLDRLRPLVEVRVVEVVASEKLRWGTGIGSGEGGFATVGEELEGEERVGEV